MQLGIVTCATLWDTGCMAHQETLLSFRDGLIVQMRELGFKDSEIALVMNLYKSTISRIIQRSNYQNNNQNNTMATPKKGGMGGKKGK